ncbi:uncharacterized protein LOC141630497 [Silene latifolia]|uniref:uncharacterized protein LOC141630497 n=1 Tax=Silene latifolia TaxID=37657 RepID=UPI003D77C55B
MTAVKATQNRFSPLMSSSKTTTPVKHSIIRPSTQNTTQNKPKDATFQGPSSIDTGKTRSVNEINGIPVLNLSEGAPEHLNDGWMLKHQGKSIPIMETISEEEELSDLLQFTHEDIKQEVAFWNNSVFCYILGANPPAEIIENFVYRIWDQFGIDRVSFLDNGIFLVRFTKFENREALLNSGYYMFDNKPVVIRPWFPETELIKEKVDIVPVWARLSGIPLRFWGACLPKIAGLVGNFLRMDDATKDKIPLSYARVMVEVPFIQKLVDKVRFLDEYGHVVVVNVEYEWNPISCSSCNGIGHDMSQCRKPKIQRSKVQQPKPKPKQIWRPVLKAQPAETSEPPHAFTPEVFTPLSMVRSTPTVKATPAKQIMWVSRQENMVGVRLSGKFSQYTFLDALNGSATPRLRVENSGLFGLLETKLKPSNLLNKYIHMLVQSKVDYKKFLLTVIYAFNDLMERIILWKFLKETASTCTIAWLWVGDFNTVLSPIERLGGNTTDAEMEHFQECVSLYEIEDIKATGALFTWSNKQAPTDRVYSRLDRAMGNPEWMSHYGEYMAHFHPEGMFDHCPCTIVDRQVEFNGKKSFKYFNMWGASEHFSASVDGVWKQSYSGTKMFNMVKKLKALKPVLKNLNKNCFSDIENSTNIAGTLLQQIQKKLAESPGDLDLIQQEYDLANELNDLTLARDSFLSQKAKIQWSISGDLNTSYFHQVIKKRVMLIKVKKSIVSIPKDKSPGSDGYTSQFYRVAWDIVGDEVRDAVRNFFDTRKLLTQINATTITLIPKMDRPTNVKHFRPISCCNVLYKPISKIMCNRLAAILPDIISKNQGAFVKGRSILENILICQDLVRLYNRSMVSPRCLFKLHLQKAYDSI